MQIKKLQRTLLGFDQINKLDDTSGSSSSDSAGTGGLTGRDMFETLNVSNEMKALAGAVSRKPGEMLILPELAELSDAS